MKRFLSLFIAILLQSCQADTKLFDEVHRMAEFDVNYELILIQSGKEKGFLEPLGEYSLFRIDSLGFNNLEHSILKSNKFKEGTFYFNDELNDYIYHNDLSIINMSKSLIFENKYDKSYYLYLLSDRKTIAVCKVNF